MFLDPNQTARANRFFGSLLLMLSWQLGASAQTDSANSVPSPANATATAPDTPRLTLGECLALAEQHQPRLRAAQQSLQAALAGNQALDNLSPIAKLLSKDLPVRKMQASTGLAVSVAELSKVRDETTYDVTYLYYSYVYAKQSEQTLRDVILQMDVYYKTAEGILSSGIRDPKVKIDRFTLLKLQQNINDIRTLLIKAVTGRKLAIAALKEAMGVDPSFDFVPRDNELPVMGGEVTLDQVVQEALCRRQELTQARVGVDVFQLEVAAQSQVRLRQQVPTFASGTDLHSRLVPLPLRNGQYRPGALAPEMPVSLVGRKDDRVTKAALLSDRQDSLYQTVVGLVRLEATNAFLEWEAATTRMKMAKQDFENNRQALEEARLSAATRQDPQFLLDIERQAGQVQAAYVEAVFEHLKALAKLERVTAGGIRAEFPNR